MKNKFLILLYGPLCSGKSSVINILMSKNQAVFHSSMDNIKWFISDYSSNKYADLGTVNRILLAMTTQAVHENLSIIIEGSAGLMKLRQKYKNLAKKNNLKFLEVNIEAPYETLLQRFKQRTQEAKKLKTKVSATKQFEMLKRFLSYKEHKNIKLPTFDSSQMSSKKILIEIKKIL